MRIGPATGVVLAGGLSLRMGRDKAAIVLEGQTLLERTLRTLEGVFPEVVVVGRSEGDASLPEGVRALADDRPGLGPLGGIATALRAATTPWIFAAACDMPFLDARPIERLWKLVQSSPGARTAAPRVEGTVQPLAAFYAKEALSCSLASIERGELSASRFLASIEPAYLDFAPGSPEARALVNINTEADLAEAEKELA